MEHRKLGNSGLPVSAIGFGCMSLGLADGYTSSAKDEAAAIALVHRALDLGIDFLDTANIYGDSEVKVGKALRGRREGAILATKFGVVPDSPANARRIDGSPAYVRQACDESLKKLQVERIDLYYLHRIDPNTPIEDTVGAMAGLVQAGKVRCLGLSEASPETVRRAHKVHPIAAVQTEYSLFSRDPEAELLPVLRELGIALVAYSPLGRGILGGRFHNVDELSPTDWRRRSNPRFQGEQFRHNLELADRLGEIAKEKGCTSAQLALAWILLRQPDVIPIPGTSNLQRLEQNARAVKLSLSEDDLDRIERSLPKGSVEGDRYDTPGMKALNG